MVDVDYKPIDAVMLYAKYARGYRQGGVNTSNAGFETWQPEKVDAYEIGSKVTIDSAVRGNFNIALFYNDFTDQQLQANAVAIPPQSPIAPLVNAGKSKIRGLEIDTSVLVFDSLRFDVGYAYLDTKLESFTPPAFDPTRFSALIPTAPVGGDLTLAPEHRVTATATYKLPLQENIGRLSIGATYTYTAEQIASSASPIGTLPSTELVNVNLNWADIAGSPVDLSLFATNLTKEEYATYVGGSSASAGYETIIPGQPRMYGVRLRYSFGR